MAIAGRIDYHCCEVSSTALAARSPEGRTHMTLERLKIRRRSGEEHFRNGAQRLDADLMSFWQWSSSDLVSNATRGVVAEYLVALALDVDVGGVRDEWAPYDLLTRSGIKVEVKSAAYLQSWYQEAFSAITFRTPKTLAWDPDTNIQSRTPQRQADVYVFALLAHKDKPSIEPLDASQWEFYVLPTSALDARERSQHSITLRTLQQLSGVAVRFDQLKRAVEEATAS